MNEQTYRNLTLQANQYADAQIPIITDFIRGLKRHDITHFCYVKVVNGSFMRFCLQNKWLRDTFGSSLNADMFSRTIKKLQQNNKLTLWQNCYSKAPSGVLFEEIKKRNINHGIIYLKQSEDGIYEFFNFATTNENHQILDFYLNHIDFLEDTTQRFMHRMGDALDHTVPGRLEPLDWKDIPTTPQLHSQKRVKLTYYSSVLNKFQEIFLTEKQYACFELLKKGYKTKQIAQILGKSPRTIDDYVEIMFDKFGISSRYELINLSVTARHTNSK